MRIRFYLSLFILLFSTAQAHTQNTAESYSVLFYNVENLFDTFNDPQKNDNEFLPDGDRHWTNYRLSKKLLNISKVILSSAGWNPSGVIGLCEVENRFVLEKLISETPLKNYPYKIIHKESPDNRGIDVALLYNEAIFYPISYQYIPLLNDNDSVIKTREMLYVSGIMNNSDTLHLLISHWPSRYGGLLETQHLRNRAAQSLRKHYDEIHNKFNDPKVIIMGDFNDQPNDESLTKFLKISEEKSNYENKDIVNLSIPWLDEETGTIKYQTQWSVFDQIMVSGSLINAKYGATTNISNAKIVRFPFLFEKDERFGGLKPRRTFYGYDYIGGFSDHLPVLLELNSNH